MKDNFGDQYLLSTFIRRVQSVSEPTTKRAQVERHLRTVEPETVAAHFQEVIGAAVRGQEIALEILFAIVACLNHASTAHEGLLDRLDLAARQGHQWSVAWLLLEPPAHREADHLVNQQRRHERALTLGERRAYAAGWKPHMLERLLRDNDPMVVARLCNNPRVSRDDILAIVTRRPTAAPLIAEVVKHPRWLREARVREAVAHSPYTATAHAIRMLPLLAVPAVHRLRFATDLHPLIGEAAAHFLALRDGEVLSVPDRAVGRVEAPTPVPQLEIAPDTPVVACDIRRRPGSES